MSNNIQKLAEILIQFKNNRPPEVAFGKVVSVTPPQIQLMDNNVVLSDMNFRSNVNLQETDGYGHYKHLGSMVSLISYFDNHKYLVLGVVQ